MRVSRLLIGAATSLSLIVSVVATPTYAWAQGAAVSDADRKAARDLFFQGVELQNAGKFAEALDKLQRAQSVLAAPTTLLHIAECQAATNKLIEAAETYRAVGRFPLGPNPSQPFVAAQSQAAGELAQLEPRIPEVTIDVTPPNIPTLQVTVDDQPLNTALIGVGRALNPGPHKIVAQAPGYSREEKNVDVKEHSKQKIVLELKSTGAVTYGVAGAPPPPVGAGATPPAGQTAQPVQGAAATPEKPAPYTPEKEAEPRSKMSILLGLRLGAVIPGGNIPLNSGGASSMKVYSETGGSIGLEAAFRFVRVLYIGGLLQAEGYGEGTSNKASSASKDNSAGGGIAALTAGWTSNPDGFGVILNAGVGHRWYSLEYTDPRRLDLGKQTASSTGTFVQLGVGLHIKVTRAFRLVPKAEVDFGTLESSSPDAGLAAARAKASFVFLGLGGLFDINLDKSASASK